MKGMIYLILITAIFSLSAVEKISDKTYEEVVLEAEKPVVLFVLAKWSKPCKQTKSLLEEIEEEVGEDVNLVRIDYDKYESFVKKTLKVKRLPGILFYREGQLVHRESGYIPKGRLLKLIYGKSKRNASGK